MTPETKPLVSPAKATDFEARLIQAGLRPLERRPVTTLQVNLGRLCNQACHHCHVEAGPLRTEIMDERTAARVLELLERSPGVGLVDLTGGAPEMNPSFRRVVTRTRELGRAVCVRSNLTILLEPGFEDMIAFFAEHGVQVVASLPCYSAENVDKQRGQGVFDGSVEALKRLNAAGYGRAESALRLDLVYNPLGAFLPGSQEDLEQAYKNELGRLFGITFDRLLTITNMPIKRFANMLDRAGATESYMQLLVRSFNTKVAEQVMCRDLVSVGHDGALYDCDFNQMLSLPLGLSEERPPRTIWDLEKLDDLRGRRVRTAAHCFGCTAGAGSSCGGALA